MWITRGHDSTFTNARFQNETQPGLLRREVMKKALGPGPRSIGYRRLKAPNTKQNATIPQVVIWQERTWGPVPQVVIWRERTWGQYFESRRLEAPGTKNEMKQIFASRDIVNKP